MFSIFKAQQLDLIRDKSSLFFVLVFPTLLVFLLGTMLSSLDNPDEAIEPMTIAYFIDGDDATTTATVEAIIAEFDDVEEVGFVAGSDRSVSEEQLITGELTSFVVFTDPFGIEIHDGINSIQNRAVHAIFESVARLHGTATVAMKELTENASVPPSDPLVILSDPAVLSSDPAVPLSDPLVILSEAKDLAGDMRTVADVVVAPTDASPPIPRVEERAFGVSRTMIDYYAVSMIVMMFFMGSAGSGASVLYNNRKDGNLRRTLASPQSRASIYLQYALSCIPYNLVQVGIVMITSTLFLGAHYAATWQANLLLFTMLFTVGLATSMVSLILGMFFRFNPMPLIMLIMWPLLFLSGTFSKEIYIPGVSEFMPPAIIQQASFDLTLFGQPDRSIVVLLVSIAILVVATIVGTALFNRKGMTT